MNSGLGKFVRASFLYWTLAAIVGIYFLVSFDFNALKNSNDPLVMRLMNSMSFKGLRLGIDLQGGTRLVLKVDIDKAYKNRLEEFGKSLDKALKKNDTPLKTKGLESDLLKLDFETEDLSRQAKEFLQAEYPELETDLKDNTVFLSLTYAEKLKIKSTAVDRAVDILNNRLDTLDVKGLIVNKHGDLNIVIQLPGVSDLADIKDAIQRSAKLEFKIVQDYSPSKEALLNKFDGLLPSDKMLVQGKGGEGSDRGWYLVSVFADVTGSKISDARMNYDQFGKPTIGFRFGSEGAKLFRDVTRNNLQKSLAIIMDDKVISAPTIQSEISSEGQITGVNQKEALRVSQLLRSGALDAPLIIKSENTVGSSLGKDSIAQGLLACLVSLLLLLVFSVLYYKLAGFLAMIALAFNLLVLLMFLSIFGATLTLMGIAGMVLTVGMAIDSSILIYEKIREELENHANFSQAAFSGFNGAMGVILDSNITTFLAGIILFWYGGPAVRGFAVTLMLGVISTVIAGVFFLRSMFSFLLNTLGLKKISM